MPSSPSSFISVKDSLHVQKSTSRLVIKGERSTICTAAPNFSGNADYPSPKLKSKMFDRFYLIASDQVVLLSKTFILVDVSDLQYRSFRDDFGPMDLETTLRFTERLESLIKTNPSRSIAMHVTLDCKDITNAAYLVGAYMILQLAMTPDEVEQRVCDPLMQHLVSFRDVSKGPQNFHLHLRDCWAGLWQADQLGWIRRSAAGFDYAAYAHYGDPLNGDLHEVVPGKFFAMRGPKGLPAGELWRDVADADGRFSHRDLSAAYYADTLRQLGAQAVVRLCAPEYDAAEFAAAGLGFADLYFEDCTCPPADVVAKFMLIAEGVPGAIAVHCRSGLGRTGTLIALYMMQHHGFSARAALGWLRIVRPGSVMGPQQQYLVDREAVMRRTAVSFQRNVLLKAPGDCGGLVSTRIQHVDRVIASALEAVDARLRAVRARQVHSALRTTLPSATASCPWGLARAGPGLRPSSFSGRPDLRGLSRSKSAGPVLGSGACAGACAGRCAAPAVQLKTAGAGKAGSGTGADSDQAPAPTPAIPETRIAVVAAEEAVIAAEAAGACSPSAPSESGLAAMCQAAPANQEGPGGCLGNWPVGLVLRAGEATQLVLLSGRCVEVVGSSFGADHSLNQGLGTQKAR